MDEERQVSATHAAASEESALKHQIMHVSRSLANASGWMKFLAILSVLSAILSVVFSRWTVLWMWLPVWLAVLLWQAAGRAADASDSGDANELRESLDRIGRYFKISGILALLGLIGGIVSLFLAIPPMLGA